jgi:imidazolonepropionase-like amidohydrolase
MVTERWLLADSCWAGAGRWLGPTAVRLGEPFDPVPVERVPAGAEVTTIAGTLLPGLRDDHVHSRLIDLRALRRGGIAAVHDLGGIPGMLAKLRRRGLDSTGELPRLEFAGAFLTAPGGYPSDRSWAAPGSWREIRSSVDAELAVGEQLAAGASWVKVALNRDAGPVLAPAVLGALVDAAHRHGAEVIAHVQGPGMMGSALAAGVDRLAHTPWTEPLDPGLLRTAADQQSCWVSTLDIHRRGRSTPALKIAIGNLRAFLERGGVVRYGTDLGNGPLPLGVNPGEIRALQVAGLTVDDVLVAITDRSAAPCRVPVLERDPVAFAQSLTHATVVSP